MKHITESFAFPPSGSCSNRVMQDSLCGMSPFFPD